MKALIKLISTILMIILVGLSSILIVKNLFFFEIIVVGSSMDSTLVDGEMGFATKSRFVKNIDYQDIIIFEKGDKEIIKRVIGKPNDHIKITEQGIYVNDELLNEEYISDTEITYNNNFEFNEITLSDDEYFVLGDNRDVSYDSRYFGPINEENITGKLFVINSRTDDIDSTSLKDRDFIKWRFY